LRIVRLSILITKRTDKIKHEGIKQSRTTKAQNQIAKQRGGARCSSPGCQETIADCGNSIAETAQRGICRDSATEEAFSWNELDFEV
jgi:hypothetical protein